MKTLTKWMPLLCGALCLGYSGCETLEPAGDAAAEKKDESVDVSFLLSMTYDEAKKLSPQSVMVPPFYKVAGDEVKVLKQGPSGEPVRVRVKGHVFMQVDFREQLTALGQEAYIESGGELIVRGKPLLKRGRSLVEGLSDDTVFYIRGTRLQVIGKHRLVAEAAADGGRPNFDVKPSWSRSWKEGPNPLLPALSPEDVPKEMRMNPLLPAPEADDVPKTLPEEVEKAIVPGKQPQTETKPAADAKPAEDVKPSPEVKPEPAVKPKGESKS